MVTTKKVFLSSLIACNVIMCIVQGAQKDPLQPGWLDKSGRFLSGIVVDVVDLHVKLFSVETAKIITAFTPFFITARFIDEGFQSTFYIPEQHKNKCQLPEQCHQVAKSGIAVPMVALSTAWIWGWNEDLRYTGRMTALGLPFVQSGKDILKNIESTCCLRPWNEHFSNKKRSSGGFPSGHMANVTFLATLWGLRHGARWAIPLSMFAVFVMADFVNCNRHYVSQLIAGTGLGVIYGIAASKVVDKRLSDRITLSISTTPRGGVACSVGCSF